MAEMIYSKDDKTLKAFSIEKSIITRDGGCVTHEAYDTYMTLSSTSLFFGWKSHLLFEILTNLILDCNNKLVTALLNANMLIMTSVS